VARIGSGTIVAGLTAGALAVISVLAVQASGTSAGATAGRPGASASPSASASASPSQTQQSHPVPAHSGSGLRVVYSLGADRVWLVGDTGKVTRTFTVAPGTVDPASGTYTVTSRTASGTGGDGVAIEHVVRFATSGGVIIGFSAARDGSKPSPDPSQKTGGIRERRGDGTALWELAVIGTKVVVVA
jgi:hypothetical protein